MTVLHTAAYNTEEDILEFLLSKQAIVDEKDDEGKDIVNSKNTQHDLIKSKQFIWTLNNLFLKKHINS